MKQPRSNPVRVCFVVTVLAASLVLGACQSEERIVSYKPFFSGLAGAETKTPAVISTKHRPVIPADATPEDGMIEEADGTRRLVARNGLALMRHVARTLAENDEALFVDQVLCEATRQEYHDRGLEPARAFHTLKRREKDIIALFSRMPAGEQSPMVVVTQLAERTQRLQLTGLAAKDLRYTGFDMVLEGARWAPMTDDKGRPVVKDGKQAMRFEPSNWRLRWFLE